MGHVQPRQRRRRGFATLLAALVARVCRGPARSSTGAQRPRAPGLLRNVLGGLRREGSLDAADAALVEALGQHQLVARGTLGLAHAADVGVQVLRVAGGQPVCALLLVARGGAAGARLLPVLLVAPLPLVAAGAAA